ncbi:hypothetical protein GOP47_0020872 [Adiantum capillus-veneris]|uniref:Sulfhydryl oxidase n=1 Tax=Adiantum capillus-veneris TaxID=13818 RepID=A0A9D4UAE1_ADICA|nr:hypothetical protein GOP47_0020872 [Adiantum capillus-veneris]
MAKSTSQSTLNFNFNLLAQIVNQHSCRHVLNTKNSRIISTVLHAFGSHGAIELCPNPAHFTAPARWAIVEFYAHWCPACRNYKPQYERVAKLFNGADAVHPGIVFMAKVDCALKSNVPLCDRFKVSHYPTLLWGQPSDFAWVSGESTGWEAIENGRKAELLLQFINNKIGKAFTLDDTISYDTHLLSGDGLDYGQVAISNFDMEEATAQAMDIILSEKLLNKKTRSSFIQFLQLLVVHHPSRNCRKGSADFLMNLEDLWPSLSVQGQNKSKDTDDDAVIQQPDFNALENYHICGDHIPRGYWMFCRGSRNETRGYSCGLWLLLHAVSVRVEDRLASSTFRTICSFIDNFFTCKECREHFLEFCSSAKIKVFSRRQLVVWLWNVHNEVNVRVGNEEASSGTGDPKFVKQLWPPSLLCKSCWNDSVVQQADSASQDLFSLSEVYSFLLKFYGHALSPSNRTISRLRDRGVGSGLVKLAFGALAKRKKSTEARIASLDYPSRMRLKPHSLAPPRFFTGLKDESKYQGFQLQIKQT